MEAGELFFLFVNTIRVCDEFKNTKNKQTYFCSDFVQIFLKYCDFQRAEYQNVEGYDCAYWFISFCT